jgi:hypothetical protein
MLYQSPIANRKAKVTEQNRMSNHLLWKKLHSFYQLSMFPLCFCHGNLSWSAKAPVISRSCPVVNRVNVPQYCSAIQVYRNT